MFVGSWISFQSSPKTKLPLIYGEENYILDWVNISQYVDFKSKKGKHYSPFGILWGIAGFKGENASIRDKKRLFEFGKKKIKVEGLSMVYYMARLHLTPGIME